MKHLLSSVSVVVLAASMAVRADVVCYEYMTIAGSTTTDGVRVLTDYVPKSNTVVRAMYSSSSAATSGAGQFLFCSRLTSGANTANLHFSFLPNSGGKFRFDYHGTQSGASSSFTANSFYMLEVKAGKAYVTDAVSGSVVTLGSGLQSFTPQYKMALFQSYSYSGGEYGSWNNAFHGKFYYLKVFDIENGEEVLKHHFVPCLDGDVVKLCDLADSNATYALTSTGSGSASVGGKVVSGAYTVDNSGTITLPAPSSYGLLVNMAPECVFDQTGDSASAENAHSFTGFQSYVGSGTFFRGGWWDFGASDATTNFFGAADGFSNRRTEFSDGAVVTNVGSVYLAGSSGTDNTLEMKGGSSMTLRQLFFGRSTSAQRSKCIVSGGSKLHCLGMVSMTEASARDRGKTLSGNEFTVTGEGSHLEIDGTLHLGRLIPGDTVNASLGGNTFAVTDGATADLHALSVGTGNVHGMKNRVVFGRNARVTMTGFSVSSSSSTVGPPNYFGSNTIEIVDGAVVTNTGNFNFGYYYSSNSGQNKSNCGNTLVISNATFVTKAGAALSSTYFIMGVQSSVRLSGVGASLKFTGGNPTFFFNGYESVFSVENGAKFTYPNNNMTYTSSLRDMTLAARSGGSLTLPNGFRRGDNSGLGTRHGLIAEDGGTITASGALYVSGTDGWAEVNDGSLVASGNNLQVGRVSETGGTGTNCELRISGTHPKVSADWHLMVLNGSRIVINLPASGYDEGYAVSTNAVVWGGHKSNSDKGIIFDSTSSTLVLNGAEEMLARHRELKKKAEYVLLSARSSVQLADEKLEALQAALPSEMSLFKRTKNYRNELVLSVKPMLGTLIVFE